MRGPILTAACVDDLFFFFESQFSQDHHITEAQAILGCRAQRSCVTCVALRLALIVKYILLQVYYKYCSTVNGILSAPCSKYCFNGNTILSRFHYTFFSIVKSSTLYYSILSTLYHIILHVMFYCEQYV